MEKKHPNVLKTKVWKVGFPCRALGGFEDGMSDLLSPCVNFVSDLHFLFFSFHSYTMVDGVMILPVLMMMAFPSPSMEGT